MDDEEINRLHNDLLYETVAINYLSHGVNRGVNFEKFRAKCRSYLKAPADIQSNDSTELLEKLVAKGYIRVGGYDVLKELVSFSAPLIQEIEDVERAINMQRRRLDFNRREPNITEETIRIEELIMRIDFREIVPIENAQYDNAIRQISRINRSLFKVANEITRDPDLFREYTDACNCLTESLDESGKLFRLFYYLVEEDDTAEKGNDDVHVLYRRNRSEFLWDTRKVHVCHKMWKNFNRLIKNRIAFLMGITEKGASIRKLLFGSEYVSLSFESNDKMEKLISEYTSGVLQKEVQEILITENFLKCFALKTAKIELSIDREELSGHLEQLEVSSRIAQQVQQLSLSEEDYHKMSKIKHWINGHAETFFSSHSNLTAISACPIRSRERKRILQQEWCIVFYCTNKGQIPNDEKLFPDKIDDYAIDVREQRFTACSKTNDDLNVSNEYHSKLSMGAQIEIEQGRIGTLGCFLQLNENSVGFLTCAHVCMSENEDLQSYKDSDKKQKVYQPDRQSSSKEIGYVRSISFTHGERFEVSVDAALIMLTDSNRLPEDGYFVKAKAEDLCRAGFDSNYPPQFVKGGIKKALSCRTAYKFGSQTGLSTGMLIFDGMALRKENIRLALEKDSPKGVIMYNQLEIIGTDKQPFFIGGDSGSLVFQIDCKTSELVAIGLAIALSDCNHAIATPLTEILKMFNFKDNCLARFSHTLPVVPPTEELMEVDGTGASNQMVPHNLTQSHSEPISNISNILTYPRGSCTIIIQEGKSKTLVRYRANGSILTVPEDSKVIVQYHEET